MIGKKKKRPQKESSRENVYFDEDLEPVEVKMVPDDQLELNEAELKEEFTKTLTSLDPNNPERRTHFNFKDGAFESKANDKHMAFHVSHEGVIWSTKEKEELEKAAREKEEKENPPPETEEAQDENAETDSKDCDGDGDENNEEKVDEEKKEKDDAEEQDDDAKDADGDESDNKSSQKKNEVLVKNQFNFSERASQTFNEPQRDRNVQTEPAPKSVFSQNANAAAIRDEYLKNLLKAKQQQLEEEEAKKRKSGFGGGGGDDAKDGKKDGNAGSESKIKHHDEGDALLHSAEMLRALKIMERVAVLNANSDSYHDFRYYASSDMRRGAFVKHLWTFRSPKGEAEKSSAHSNRMVTCLEWNRDHLDLFAVGYGSYSFNEQTSGQICIYSLKSTAFPEKRIQCESGVMCLSFHPKYPSLLCCGSYDGSVAVYDVRNRDDSPIYSSENPQSHHADPVWAITWFHPLSELQHDLVFYSISSDAALKTWRMSQNELSHEVLMVLQHEAVDPSPTSGADAKDISVIPAEEEDAVLLPAMCCCFDFNRQMEHLYLVGTEDGHIMECNKTYTDGPTALYANAHHMNVYAVKWNPFHAKIFISCSEDWTIKLWETANVSQQGKSADKSPKRTKTAIKGKAAATPEPIITYDLGCSVNDLAWSPYSATIFGAVTADGRVHIFDLAQNKNAPLVSEPVSKSALTTIAFPVGFPLVIVGDEKGVIYAHKLSPNLYLDPMRHRDLLKNVAPDMFSKAESEPFRIKQKERLEQKLSVTGNKVFDLAEHFSPKPLKKAQFTKSMRWKSPTALKK